MQTLFSPEQRRREVVREADAILRTCVHCGFCTATCPTYVLLGDELDSPRGRIYLIKDMMEGDKPATEKVVRHIDRCLSCLSCMTTCPSGVDYMHLIDRARVHIHRTYRRPFGARCLRAVLAWVLVRPKVFRLSLIGARLARPFQKFLPGRLKGMVAMAPAALPRSSPLDRPGVHVAHDIAHDIAQGKHRLRVALHPGCAQQVLAPRINAAAVRLLTRLGCEVVISKGLGCCGALVHHMGREDDAQAQARANVAAWVREMDGAGLDAIVVTASGCGTTLKDYGYLLKDDPQIAAAAQRVAALVRDISEVLIDLGMSADKGRGTVVGYHAPCSMQHGQKLKNQPQELLRQAGFDVREPAEAHLCCGSAGTYNLLQPDLAARLGARKVENLDKTEAAMIATGNIGCMVQIAQRTEVPVVHTVELLDWAMGGPKPAPLV
ncbi:glycolate oxidase subunit GlcF [Varunaivibrio sulfuroxidans]|uniref:Glycolate oxidase iron-sulfur subunit n=1 Tax=Varunaivibrio sulfuroxidans TaxID=1773489 RepID=A0A4V2UN82_9PROT|nr:glycolate oxidase subunit GlcF [Varunaivibrio sulfuroxidans]TCS60961.1 glycolate oxidase iron-sulfur subunit [Varunaivibrio sulfuroxidans]WES31633.1 glycolate oxidase subunit GlcF [Varunaivibrio sulfuroxidans]